MEHEEKETSLGVDVRESDGRLHRRHEDEKSSPDDRRIAEPNFEENLGPSKRTTREEENEGTGHE